MISANMKATVQVTEQPLRQKTKAEVSFPERAGLFLKKRLFTVLFLAPSGNSDPQLLDLLSDLCRQ